MADTKLVGLTNTLDIGRQRYNEAVATFYNTPLNSVPEIDGLLKSWYNHTGKSRLYGKINGEWKIFAYEGPVPTDVFYYDEENETLIMEKPLNAGQINVNNLDVGTGTFNTLEAKNGTIEDLTVNVLNVVKNINQTDLTRLMVEDNTIVLNSNLESDPDEANYLYAGVVVHRGNVNDASLKWDEVNNRWILEIPSDNTDSDPDFVKTLELFGITDDTDRKIDIKGSSGFYFDTSSVAKNPGLYSYYDNYTSGIYLNGESEKYNIRDRDGTFELAGLDLSETGERALQLFNSKGVEVYSSSGNPVSIDLIQLDSNGNKIGTGSLVYDYDTLTVSTNEKTFELKDIDEWDPFGQSWYYSNDVPKGGDRLTLPSGYPLYQTDEGLVQVFVNGLHIRPELYTIEENHDGNSQVVFNEPLTEDSTVTVYHDVFMSENYRLPLKSLPNVITGVTGKVIYATNSKGAVTGEIQVLVLKNSKILAEGVDYECERVSENRCKIILTEELVVSDTVTVYPFLSPNIFVKGTNALVFDTTLENPEEFDSQTAYILFRRGSLPSAGIRWDEGSNTLQVNNGTNVWEPITTGGGTRFDKKRYEIASDSNTLNIVDLLNENGIYKTDEVYFTVFKNGFLMDNPEDYSVGVDSDNKPSIIFTKYLTSGDIVWVYIGKSFLKSSNYLINKKYVGVIEEDTTVVEFGKDFVYEPGTDTLNLFVNGMLVQKDIDYIELNERAVMFHYKLEVGTVIQAYCPRITNNVQYSSKTLEFNIAGEIADYLTSDKSNCKILVNRGTAAEPAYIKWDEVSDSWYLSNGNGKDEKILTSSTNGGKKFAQILEYTGDGTSTLSISDMVGKPDELLIFYKGSLVDPSDYTYDKDNRKIDFEFDLASGAKISVLAYTSAEIQYIVKYKNAYIQKYSRNFQVLTKTVSFDLDKTTNETPQVTIFLNGTLLPESEYTVTYTSDYKKCTIKFEAAFRGDLTVLVNINTEDKSLINGVENTLLFENNQELYDDDSTLGNWYIRSNRGKALSPAYIRWDELANKFKFNPGENKEYEFPKVVFSNEFFTPEDINDHIILVLTRTQSETDKNGDTIETKIYSIYAWVDKDWRPISGGSSGSVNISDAPIDGHYYGVKNGVWQDLEIEDIRDELDKLGEAILESTGGTGTNIADFIKELKEIFAPTGGKVSFLGLYLDEDNDICQG